ncbi:DUF3347 domain-containing protein [Leeuwenhoekiella marinoflava]|uniref:DUF3347 domain-containing protein n=2 Tax=Leeuwenhoekiella marinoflava TaxID=988 RepID=A0A4Q0PDT6_9FLAO|nr:DUF3347 domain-containing protein [Leeuwenhoekiella marinoflava]RXG25040.1 putative protein DUF3347 [Leeuwenhoekiella marinoflava]SHF90783.1 Protein of unknown function [Leeuwenhoekiella marinoflava DSM 3653]
MKKIALTLASVLVLSCGEKKSNQETVTVGHGEVAHKIAYSGAKRDAEFQNAEVAQVYDDYNALKIALVNTDEEVAQTIAQKLVISIEAVKVEASLVKAVEAIANSENINEQRAQFENLTAGIKTLVEENITSGTLYYQYCPMAFDGKGAYWIANEKKVFNPYFGDVMLNCGTVDSKIE